MLNQTASMDGFSDIKDTANPICYQPLFATDQSYEPQCDIELKKCSHGIYLQGPCHNMYQDATNKISCTATTPQEWQHNLYKKVYKSEYIGIQCTLPSVGTPLYLNGIQ